MLASRETLSCLDALRHQQSKECCTFWDTFAWKLLQEADACVLGGYCPAALAEYGEPLGGLWAYFCFRLCSPRTVSLPIFSGP